eukprot:1785878-Alexandrium_andersonii.AAC.1
MAATACSLRLERARRSASHRCPAKDFAGGGSWSACSLWKRPEASASSRETSTADASAVASPAAQGTRSASTARSCCCSACTAS